LGVFSSIRTALPVTGLAETVAQITRKAWSKPAPGRRTSGVASSGDESVWDAQSWSGGAEHSESDDEVGDYRNRVVKDRKNRARAPASANSNEVPERGDDKTKTWSVDQPVARGRCGRGFRWRLVDDRVARTLAQ